MTELTPFILSYPGHSAHFVFSLSLFLSVLYYLNVIYRVRRCKRFQETPTNYGFQAIQVSSKQFPASNFVYSNSFLVLYR